GGNGVYAVSFPDAGNFVTAPSTEGASLVVIYKKDGLPNKTILLHDGAVTIPFDGRSVDGSSFATTITGFSPASNTPKARITYVVGDGQPFEDQLFFNGTSLGSNIFSGSSGPLWDNLTFDVSSLISPGTTQVTTFSPIINDCLTFGALVFAIDDEALILKAGFGVGPSDPGTETKSVGQGAVSASVPLASQFCMQLAKSAPPPNQPTPISSLYVLTHANVAPAISDPTLFPNNVVIEYHQSTSENTKLFTATHLGTVTVTITPDDTSISQGH